ncbi:MAG: cytidine deaminase [Alphaproteobacteria bacterium]|nr:cytidine deaminase [Alphaproteobacteria bacterium]
MTKIKPEELIKKAADLIKKRYNPDFHKHHTVVAAAVLSKSGKIYTSVNAGTYQPSIATCAEIVAIGMGNTAEKDFEIDTIVAMRDVPPYPISPCGKCREYISDYGPKAKVIMPADNKKGWELVKIADLIPGKYVKKEE